MYVHPRIMCNAHYECAWETLARESARPQPPWPTTHRYVRTRLGAVVLLEHVHLEAPRGVIAHRRRPHPPPPHRARLHLLRGRAPETPQRPSSYARRRRAQHTRHDVHDRREARHPQDIVINRTRA